MKDKEAYQKGVHDGLGDAFRWDGFSSQEEFVEQAVGQMEADLELLNGDTEQGNVQSSYLQGRIDGMRRSR